MTAPVQAARAAAGLFESAPVTPGLRSDPWTQHSNYTETSFESSLSNDDSNSSHASACVTKKSRPNDKCISPNKSNEDLNTSFFFLQDTKLENQKEKVADDVMNLNKLRDFYKSEIKELPPVFITAAKVVSQASKRASSGDNSSFTYKNTIEIEKPIGKNRKRSLNFNPPVNSTTNENSVYFENIGNISILSFSTCDTVTNIPENTFENDISLNSPFKVNSSGFPRKNRSVQTMITMDDVSKLTEVVESCGGILEPYILNSSLHNAETHRLSTSRTAIPDSPVCDEGCWNSMRSVCDSDISELTDSVRVRVVNWLVILDERIGSNILSLQCAVRFLDDLSTDSGAAPEPALLHGAACFWIASKLQSSRTPGARRMAQHCGDAFTPRELVACEKTVFKSLGFPAAPVLPADEVESLVAACGLAGARSVRLAAHYLCCCALLHARAATTAPRALAAAAVAVAASALHPRHYTNQRLRLLREHDTGWSAQLERTLRGVCRDVSRPASASRELFLRYSSRECREVASRLALALATSTK